LNAAKKADKRLAILNVSILIRISISQWPVYLPNGFELIGRA
jgi:hypothetical protein